MRATTFTSRILWTFAIAVCWMLLGGSRCVQAGPVYGVTLEAAPTQADGGPNPNNTQSAYNGTWQFEVTTTKDMITFTIVATNGNRGLNKYKGDSYTYAATVNDGVYTFTGTSLASKNNSDYNLGMAGTYDSNKMTLMLTVAPNTFDTTKYPLPPGVTATLTSQQVKNVPMGKTPITVEYYVTKIASVPEPSTVVLGLLALGILTTASTLKRRSRSMMGQKR